jgi:hypothetical protein
MRVQFEFTIEEQVDDLFASTIASPRARMRMQRDRFTTALSAGALIFLLIPGNVTLRPWIALALAAVWGLLFPRVWRALVRRRLTRFVRASLSPEGPYICNVEIGDDGVRVGQQGMEVTYRWSDIVDVADAAGSVELLAADGSSVVVKDRAFATPAERERFIALAREYREAAGSMA